MKEALMYLLTGLSSLVQPEHRQDFVFERGVTHWIRGPVHLHGTTTIEGGAVVKFEPGTFASLIVHGPVDCRTGPGDPAFFTGRDDDSVGLPLPGPDIGPAVSCAFHALALSDPAAAYDLHDLRIRRARYGLALFPGTTASIRHVQIVEGVCGVASLSRRPVHLGNALMLDVEEAFRGFSESLTAEHLTLHRAQRVQRFPVYPVRLTNSLLVEVTQVDGWRGDGVWVLAHAEGVFAGSLGGAHYLPESSPLRGSAIVPVSLPLREELEWRTTERPIRLSGLQAGPLVLGPAPRPVGVRADPGYHYDRLDCVLDGFQVGSGELSFLPGTTVGVGSVELLPGSRLRSIGGAAAPVRWIDVGGVHEAAGGSDVAIRARGTAAMPAAARFEHSILLGGDRLVLDAGAQSGDIGLRHCTLKQADIEWTMPVVGGLAGWTNNLLEGVRLRLTAQSNHLFAVRNHDLLRSTIELAGAGARFQFEHNLFHDAVLTTEPGVGVVHAANAYLGRTDRWLPPHGQDWVHADPPAFVAGPLGERYVPAQAPSMTGLIDGGLAPASGFGLHAFTTQPDDSIEGHSPVDLGYHYPAGSTQGPLDGDGDGLADVQEDANGNGFHEPGETSPDLADTDLDGWDDGAEARVGLSPTLGGLTWDTPQKAGLTLYTPLE